MAERASSLALERVQVEFLPHASLKRLSHRARAVIRTGEATPFANVVLFSGVIFAAAG